MGKGYLTSGIGIAWVTGAFIMLLLVAPGTVPLASARSQNPWQFELYRLIVPSSEFYKSIDKSRLGVGWISGPPPKGLVPTLGVIDRYESEPGKFNEGTGLIYVYQHGFVDESGKLELKITTRDPTGEWLSLTIEGDCDKCKVDGTTSVFVFPRLSSQYGVWRIGAQISIGAVTRVVGNASFTVGKYYADISVDGLPSNARAEVDLDGARIGEANGTTSIALGWLPEHTVRMQDVATDASASRYHVQRPEVKVSGPGECHFDFGLQHYLDVESPYAVDGSGWYDHGATVTLTAPAQEAPEDTRITFQGWTGDYSSKDAQISVPVDGPKRVSAQYVTQHLLAAVSEFGDPQGSGWYDAGSSATFSVSSTSSEGIMGMLGGRQIFVHWTGDSNAATPTASVLMDGPKSVTAEWRTDYTAAYAVLGIAIALIAVAALWAVKRKTL